MARALLGVSHSARQRCRRARSTDLRPHALIIARGASRTPRQKTFTSEERKKGQQQQQQHGKKGKRQRGKVVSSTALTPGTPFMHDICVSLTHWVCARLGSRKWQHVSARGRARARAMHCWWEGPERTQQRSPHDSTQGACMRALVCLLAWAACSRAAAERA